MKLKMKFLAIVFGTGIFIVLIGLYSFKSISNIDDGYIAQPPWKNLKVLPQDISKDSLDHLMDNYATSLGVKCNYCHMPSKTNPTKLDFPDDGKIEKEIARGMIVMADEINAKYFQPHFPDPKPKQVHVINCVVCHRGAPNPEKYLSQMNVMYKTYDPNRDNRKEMILKHMEKDKP